MKSANVPFYGVTIDGNSHVFWGSSGVLFFWDNLVYALLSQGVSGDRSSRLCRLSFVLVVRAPHESILFTHSLLHWHANSWITLITVDCRLSLRHKGSMGKRQSWQGRHFPNTCVLVQGTIFKFSEALPGGVYKAFPSILKPCFISEYAFQIFFFLPYPLIPKTDLW